MTIPALIILNRLKDYIDLKGFFNREEFLLNLEALTDQFVHR